MIKIKLFIGSMLATTIVLLAIIYFTRPAPRKFHLLAGGVFVSSQINFAEIRDLRRNKVQTVVDLRPDGEASDEPSSETMGLDLQASGIGFFYDPVPHGKIPDAVVARLADVLAHHPKPALIYCRTGRRAAASA